ncbi:MAG: hypothetical protein JNL17_11080 [Cyclobacteriaceae bacterium]|nr:hypothetical protein [Cyclobacteriaceae bacterium]
MMRILIFLLLSQWAFAQKEFTLVMLHKRQDLPAMPKEEVDKLMQGHFANMEKLHKEGHLVAAGPFEGGGGIFIFNSTNRADIDRWLADDPGVQAQRWRLEVLPYKPVIGSICAVSEPYQMVNYSFIRFVPQLTKDNQRDATRLFLAHQDLISGLNTNKVIITHVQMGELEDLVIATEAINADRFATDPAVQQGLLAVEAKKLFIAKGSFCEK